MQLTKEDKAWNNLCRLKNYYMGTTASGTRRSIRATAEEFNMSEETTRKLIQAHTDITSILGKKDWK